MNSTPWWYRLGIACPLDKFMPKGTKTTTVMSKVARS